MPTPSSSFDDQRRHPSKNNETSIRSINPIDPKTEQSSLLDVCRELNARVTAFLETESPHERVRQAQAQTRTSLGVIRQTLDRYNLPSLSVSYNGGKDCLVLLILFLSALATHPTPLPPKLQSVYIVPQHAFPEMDAFVEQTARAYHLDVARYARPSMKAAFAEYLHDKRGVSPIEAIFVGTRRTDPHGAALGFFDETDRGWPKFMRVHPLVEWRYAEVWTFIRTLNIPYCPLYDLGYTSLGGTNDTYPNPALRRTSISAQSGDTRESLKRAAAQDKEEKVVFRPAYELSDDEEERLGRA
ncbi:MAG: hypothetical protein M1825_003178 [Sarcosagium campestre]|nr:MAG: hypothetical protein M1825_003178 [Sarcosagium campestre]